MINYDNITLISREISEKRHRGTDCDTSVYFSDCHLTLPVFAAPMPDVCNGRMAGELARLGALGIIHRFQSVDAQVSEYQDARRDAAPLKRDAPNITRIACAIGVTGDFVHRFEALASRGCRIFCFDTANGANTMVGAAVEAIRNSWKTFPEATTEKLFLIAGNVATADGFEYLSDIVKVDAVRVGIAGGSVCETKTETGIHIPTLQSISDVAEWRARQNKTVPLIIADGGIRTPADMNKALALGADLVMAGGIFAGTRESPGNPIIIEGRKYKLYRGAASYSVQQESGKTPLYNEGDETMVHYKGAVENVIDRFRQGLQSSMSYANAGNLQEYRKNILVLDL